MSPAALRSLADRVEAEEPSYGLAQEVLVAFNNPLGPNPLTSIDAAAALMPEGWEIDLEQSSKWFYGFAREESAKHQWEMRMEKSFAPTEPRARTALACRVKAAVMEANDE